MPKVPSATTQTWSPFTEDVGDSRDDVVQAASPAVPEGERYEDRGLLGRGGMGEVRLTHDSRLERDLALKASQLPTTAASASLLAEARTTARLEHPSIVPVYDAGKLEDGRPYYTMPVLRGRSLAQRIHEAPDLSARLRLLRHFQDACEATAYAHDQGLAHRDLKPANIMVGEFGETRVVDWGLACPIVVNATAAEHRKTGLAGTPAYMSPEQARGAPVTPLFDVFSLGATLHELLTAQAPRAEGALHAPIPPVRSRCPEVPPELAAIADRATAESPAARYPNAVALAADVEAWFEGRRVAAHSYTLREELARFVSKWRVPLAVGAVMGIALILALVAGWQRTRAERNRALAAESTAIEAREASDASLMLALVAQAQVAAEADLRSEAEILAVNALEIAPSPEARGVLARYGLEPRPRLIRTASLPTCNEVTLSPSGDQALCIQDEQVLVLSVEPGGAATRTIATQARYAAFVGEDRVVTAGSDARMMVHDLQTERNWPLGSLPVESRLQNSLTPDTLYIEGRGRVYKVAMDGTRTIEEAKCPPGRHVLVNTLRVDGVAALVCADRSVVLHEPGQPPKTIGVVDPTLGEPNMIATDAVDAHRVVVGTERGEVVVLEEGRGETWRHMGRSSPVMVLALRGRFLAIRNADGELSAWDLAERALITRLPAGQTEIFWRDEGATLRMIGRSVEDWAIPELGQRQRVEMGAGVSALDVSPTGDRLSVSLGNGDVRVLDAKSGRELLRVPLGAGVAKTASFSPDGSQLLLGRSGLLEAQVISSDGTLLQTWDTGSVRRANWLRDGTKIIIPYLPGLLVQRPQDPTQIAIALPKDERLGDLAVWPDGSGATLIDQRDRLYRLTVSEAGPLLTPLERTAEARGIAGSREVIWVAHSSWVGRYDASGRLQAKSSLLHQSVTSVASSADQRLVALGHFNGDVSVLSGDTLTMIARLRGHDERISALAFHPEGRWLASGSWDQSVRYWDLSVLNVDPTGLARRLEEGWGRGLDDALRR